MFADFGSLLYFYKIFSIQIKIQYVTVDVTLLIVAFDLNSNRAIFSEYKAWNSPANDGISSSYRNAHKSDVAFIKKFVIS